MIPSITTIVPPAGQNLVSLAQVKQYLASSDNDTDLPSDALLQGLIRDASAGMIMYLGVDPARQKYQELSRGNGEYRRWLSRLPVERGSLAVTFNGDVLAESDPVLEFPYPADGSQFVLEDPAVGSLYRLARWWWSPLPTFNIIDTYYAGFLLPDQIAAWGGSSPRTLGSWTRSTLPALLRFECTTAGTSGASEPVWPTTIGATVTDGSITWTARAATELPAIVSQWCWVEVARLLADLDWSPNLVSRNVQGVSESRFSRKVDDGTLAPTTISGLTTWRKELGLVGVA